MLLNVLMHDITKFAADAVVAGFFEDVRPLKGAAGALDWVLCGVLSRLIVDGRMSGALGEVALVTSGGKVPASKIFLLGLGPRSEAGPESLRIAARTAAASIVGAGAVKAGIDCFPLGDGQNEETLAAIREGLIEGAAGRPISVTFVASNAAMFDQLTGILNTRI